jgi:hypothetical protein
MVAIADNINAILKNQMRRIRAGNMIYKTAVLLAMPIDRTLFDMQVEIMKTACEEYLSAAEQNQ